MEKMVISPDFWKGKKVFLTGHTGFKGSWLSLFLETLGAEVTGYALAPHTDPSLFSSANTAKNMKSIMADIRDYASLSKAVTECEPDIIIHAAAQALVRTSYENPVDTYAINLLGTVHLLEAARHCASVKAVVIITTDKCYENREWVWAYRENDTLGGHDPYSNSKACAELATQAYRDSFFHSEQTKVGIASARAGNVIGGGDWSENRLIPDLIKALHEKKALHLRYPEALRPWQHVLDSLSGYLLLAEKLFQSPLKYSEAWNFGPDSASVHSVISVVKKTMDFYGDTISLQVEKTNLHEAQLLMLDSAKSHARLNWHPVWNLDKALQKTADWYQHFFKNPLDIREFTLSQIQDYLNNIER